MLTNRALQGSTWLALSLSCALFGGCAAPAPGDGSDVSFPDEPFATVTSENGAFVVEVRTAPSQPPVRGRTYVELRIADEAGEPVEDLTLSAVPFMPDMAHGTSSEPEVASLGDGRYEIAPVDMVMSGRWELRTTVEAPVEDSARVQFEIE
ncbi:MAG: FixH family protein [Polyangiaceae bacterium]